jgi:hypothetical protein
VDYNDQLSQAITQQLQQAKAWMNTPILTEYDEIKGREKCFSKIRKGKEVSCGCNIFQCPFGKTKKRVETIKKYQTFLFGKNAVSLTGVQDASIYKGSYRNATDYNQIS